MKLYSNIEVVREGTLLIYEPGETGTSSKYAHGIITRKDGMHTWIFWSDTMIEDEHETRYVHAMFRENMLYRMLAF